MTLALSSLEDGFECDACVLGQIIDLPVGYFNDILQVANVLLLINLKCFLFLLPVLIPFGLPILLQLLEQAQETWWNITVHVNANEGKLSLRMFFCTERD